MISFCWSPQGLGPGSVRRGWRTEGVFLSQGATTTAHRRQRQDWGHGSKGWGGQGKVLATLQPSLQHHNHAALQISRRFTQCQEEEEAVNFMLDFPGGHLVA